MKDWFNYLVDAYEFTESEYHLIQLAAFAYDRSIQAKKILDKEGLTYLDKYDCPHPRPEAQIEKQSQLTFARLVKPFSLGSVEDTPAGRKPGYSSGGKHYYA